MPLGDETVLVMIARIDENVISLKKSSDEQKKAFDEHVLEDKKVVSEFLRPLWESRQQEIGAARTRKSGGAFAGFAFQIGVSVISAWAAVKALK